MFLNFRGDLVGGLTAGIISLPLSLAFGIASGLGASAGIYCAIILTLFVSIAGGTKTQISGPTGPMTVIISSVVVAFGIENLSLILAVFVLAGFFQICFGILKFGQFVKFIPYPVISGFMNGIGVIIIILQIPVFFGNDGAGNVIGSLMKFKETFANIDYASTAVGIATLLMIFFTPKKYTKIIPPALIALVVLSLIVYIFDIDIKTIGEIPTGLPNFHIPQISFDKISMVVLYAAMLALLGSIDSLLTLVVTDSLTKTRQNPNKELIGQGLGNMFCGFFGGVVGASATMRTLVNIKAGGKTPISGIISSIFLLLVLLIIAPLVSFIPLAVLSGILIKVGIDILDYRFLKGLKNAPAHDLIVAALVFLLTVFVDLIIAVGVGVIASCILLMYRISLRTNVEIQSDENELNRIKDGIRIFSINGPFFFGSTSQIIDRTSDLIETKVLIIDCSNVSFIDLSGAYALEDMINTQLSYDVKVLLVLKKKRPK